jgi:hypothetical protein
MVLQWQVYYSIYQVVVLMVLMRMGLLLIVSFEVARYM